jgi:hypothetical protein
MADVVRSLDPEPTVPFRPQSLQQFDRTIGEQKHGHVPELVATAVGGAVLPPRPSTPTPALPSLAERLKARLERGG